MTKPAFQSTDWHFRPTSLAAAMQSAGMDISPALIREPKLECNGQKLRVNTSTDGAFGKEKTNA